MARDRVAGISVIVPSGWATVSFGEITKWSRYGINTTADLDGRYPMLRMNNIQDGQVQMSDLVFVNLSDQDIKTHRLSPGEILINRTNSYELVGKAALFEDGSDADYVCASYIVRFGVDTARAVPKYVNYFLNSDSGQQCMKKLATRGVSQANINPTVLKDRLYIPLPPLPEQRKIAAILGTWDAASGRVEQLIAALQRRKQGLMQRLLTGAVRFPEFAGTETRQQTRYTSLPAEWDYVAIGEIAREVSLRNTDGDNLSVLSCTKYDGLVDSLSYFGRQIFSEDTSSYKVVKRRQFAYATNHIEEGSIGYQDLYDAALISPMYTVFETTDRVNDAFLYRLLKTELYRHIFEVNTSGTVNRRGRLGWDDFARIRVPLPSEAEQRKIAEFFATVDREIALQQQRLAQLQAQKKGLMQRLLTGQVRVKVDSVTPAT